MSDARVYIDQNILGYVRDGTLGLGKHPNITWVYSNEHFNEMSRSDDRSFLDALEKLEAQQIELILDDRFRVTDRAQINPYSSPHEQYDRYLNTVAECDVDEGLFTGILARLYGADNYPELEKLPDRFVSEIEQLLEPVGKWGQAVKGNVDQVAGEMATFIRDQLNEATPMESHRKLLGTDKGKIGKLGSDNPLLEIWGRVGPKVQGLTPDQFFGFDPHDKQGYETWPMYFGIISCHSILNFIGYRPDQRISSEKAIQNSLSDAIHAALGAYCDALLSEDKRLCAKASAIYKYKKINTQALHLEFLHR